MQPSAETNAGDSEKGKRSGRASREAEDVPVDVKEGFEKVKGVQNDAGRYHEGEKDIERPVSEENGKFHLSEGKKDVEKIEGAENNTVQFRQEKKATERPDGESNVINCRGDNKELEEPEGAKEGDAVYLSKGNSTLKVEKMVQLIPLKREMTLKSSKVPMQLNFVSVKKRMASESL